MVRSHNRHFTCAVLIEGKWTYIDDLCSGVKQVSNLAELTKHFVQGWFFLIFEVSNMVCESQLYELDNEHIEGSIDFTEIPIYLGGVEYLIIDEFSVIGQKMFAWINRRCKQATGYSTVPFGGIPINLVRDIPQLPPITDQVLYHTRPNSGLAIEGYCMYEKFEKVVKFEVNERARGADDEQQRFRALQIRARDGNSNLEDRNMLLLRQPQNVVDIDNFENSSVKLSFGNEKVAKDNDERLKDLQQIIVQINAHHSNPKAKSLSSEEMSGLEPTIYVSKQARVMLTRNLWTKAGLCNGNMGTIKDNFFRKSLFPDATNCYNYTV